LPSEQTLTLAPLRQLRCGNRERCNLGGADDSPGFGSNRVDNPGRYDTLYVGDTTAGAVAEAFGWAPRWNVGMLRGTPSLPGSVRALGPLRAARLGGRLRS
jgi:hypothetical protein